MLLSQGSSGIHSKLNSKHLLIIYRYALAASTLSTLYVGAKLSNFKMPQFSEMQSSESVAKARLNQMFEVLPDEITIYHFYNSTDLLHDEFNSKISDSIKTGAEKACAQTCSIDICDLGEEEEKLVRLGKQNLLF